MKSHTRNTAIARAVGLFGLLLAAGVSGCNKDRILDVTDPDVINPTDIVTPEGAEALRVGALGRLSGTTSGGESFFLLGGLLADEWRSGGPFQQHQETDSRNILTTNTVLEGAWYRVNRARTAANQAIAALTKYSPTLTANIAQMYFVRGYAEMQIAENYCNGTPLSALDQSNNVVYGSPLSNAEVYARAIASFDSAIAIAGTGGRADSVKVLASLNKGRILLDQGKYAEAAAAVASVPTAFKFFTSHSQTTVDNQIWALNNNIARYVVGTNDGGVGLNFATANDVRVPVCEGGSTVCKAFGVSSLASFDGNFGRVGSATGALINAAAGPYYVQLNWPGRSSPFTIISGLEARLIEAEAQLKSGQTATWLATLNTLRASFNTLKQPGNPCVATGTQTAAACAAIPAGGSALPPLSDPGTTTAREDLMFRERAFWLWSTGHRLPDLRRLIRPTAQGGYGRAVNSVYPNGTHLLGGTFGTDIVIPVPNSELNNPNFKGCTDRNP